METFLSPTDLIAISTSALIIIENTLNADSRDMIFDYYTEIGGCTDETECVKKFYAETGVILLHHSFI
ncbi:hypothetical protein [Peptostreptococcus porci]|uniref:hypothetical protein n=1 Tax=Peptostreptococcus porci TaxID=2652282 RepID=UPI002A801841|nr:hypothetical protein [Peptostreptococcus porci]MDY4127996.1 hypothetical protein [Peptostreptococcus porci]